MGLLPDRAYDDFVADALDVAPDAQGRIVVPESLRRRAGIGDKGAEVLLAGVGHHVEIWDRRRYEGGRAARDGDVGAKTLQALKI
jgi:DNA-binding transcriptional regulator/RsmH inhibitor MraZ